MNDRRLPKLRFKGFKDDWEQRKVGKLTNVLSASRVHKEEWAEDGVPFFRSSDVVSAFKGTENEKAFISVELYEQLAKSSGKLEKNDILITGGGSIGIPYIMPDNKPLYSKDADLIWIKHSANFDSIYLYTYFMSEEFREYLASISHTGTIAHYTIEQVKDTPVRLPSIDEQRKLGNFFVSLDHLITLHQRKLEKLKIVKKAMLENCFPKNGEKVPKFRFSGFTGDWEQRKLDEISDRYDNLRIPVAASLRISGPIPYYGANGIQDYVEGYTHEGEFVLVAEDGANDLKNYPVKCVKGRIWVNNHAHVLQAKSCIADNYFLAFSLNRADIESLLVGGGRAKLNAETMMNISLMFPSITEQREIGKYILSIDHLITLHQRKLEKLKLIKKSFLEKMFV